MATALIIRDQVENDQAAARALVPFRERVAVYIRRSRAENTLRGYRSDWADFTGWCAGVGLVALPASAETVASYLSTLADRNLKSGSIQRRVSAIAASHTAAGFDPPTQKAAVRLCLAGIRRALGTRQEGKAAVLTVDLAHMLRYQPAGLLGLRDRAMLLVGYAGAFRRSELVGLDVQDVEFSADGAKILIRQSKTDQEGAGQVVGIARGTALCPCAALQAWLEAAGIVAGPLFRSVNRHGQVQDGRLHDQTVAMVIKKYATAAGLDAAKFAGHSLRAGLVTQAAIAGVPDRAIMRQTRHKSSAMLGRYIRDVSLFRENASAKLGL